MKSLGSNSVITASTVKYTGKVGEGAVKFPKSRKSEIDDSMIKIVHTMADGTTRDSVEGYEIPYNDATAIVYELLAKWIESEYKKQIR